MRERQSLVLHAACKPDQGGALFFDDLNDPNVGAAEERARASAAEYIANFDRAVERLRLGDVDVPLIRATVREPEDVGRAFAPFAVSGITLIGVWWKVNPYILRHGRFSWPVHLTDLTPALTIGGLGVVLLWLLARTRLGGTPVRDQLIHDVARQVIKCGRAYGQDIPERVKCLAQLDYGYYRVERSLLRAHRRRRTMAWVSLRHSPAMRHAAFVAAALRQDLLRVDVDSDPALRDLAGKLLTVGERYAEGRVGGLLPEEVLQGLEPISLPRKALQESARAVLIILAALAGAVVAHKAAGAFGHPWIEKWLPLAGAVVAGIIVGGWHRVSQMLPLAPGKG
ncbi:hypothetical protein [Streptomyces sp. NPDC007905]|uniref:hypothetical protein n=1 Tax=Streptomyces sp. NPDC007905 TaxID=3364788 RepID=UPI0036E76C71